MKKISLQTIGHAILFLLVSVCVILAIYDQSQAVMAMLLPVEFEGEYSLDEGETWKAYTDENDLYANSDTIYLKGHLAQE